MKEATKKILSPHGVLSPSDLTADEKKEIYALFEAYEMPQSTAYIACSPKVLMSGNCKESIISKQISVRKTTFKTWQG